MQPKHLLHAIGRRTTRLGLALIVAGVLTSASAAELYENRFTEIRNEIYDPANGYLSADGGPYHAIETFIVEAPDHGHQSTSEAYSYILWLEALHGKLTGDWQPLADAWNIIETQIIPTTQMQPTADGYNPAAPATYVPEGPLPSSYPLPLTASAAVGNDPISQALAQEYGTWEIYGMHWLLDLDNVYGYGNLGDGVSTPSYINTFQRGEQESVWETVPHPSWDDFSWGGQTGFLDLFVQEQQAPAQQWRYTNAPDADARVVQVMYWALQWMKAQGKDPEQVAPGLMAKAAKMGDYLRLAMFDKYFKTLGAQSESGGAGSGYDSAHYLMSWFYSWGGPLVPQGWAWRIGSSHVHFAYQNPMAAYALSQVPELIPATPGARRDWETGLERSLQFFQWTQSAEGAFSGGATNSWNGTYDTYPHNRTFYGMVYTPNPVYADPGSGTWFGWQAWGTERLAEYYYLTGEPRTKAILDKWIGWVLAPSPAVGKAVLDFSDNDVKLAAELAFTGLPAAWNPANPQPNNDLHVEVITQNQDVGVAHSLAKTLMYYAAAEQLHQGAVHVGARDAAQTILDRFWTNHRTAKGVATLETRGDYSRVNDPVYFPPGWTGTNAVGAALGEGTTFIGMRPFYQSDPGYQEVLNAAAEGRDPAFVYHRYWAQVEVATANALFADLFPVVCQTDCPPLAQPQAVSTAVDTPVAVTLAGTDSNGSIVSYNYTQPANGSVTGTGATVTYTPAGGFSGSDAFTFTVTDDENLTSAPATVSITVTDPAINRPPVAQATADPDTGDAPLAVNFSAAASSDPDNDPLTYSWDFGDGNSGTGISPSHTYTGAGNYTAVLTVGDGEFTDSTSLAITVTAAPTGVSCDYVVQNQWNTGFTAVIRLTNNGATAVNGWQVGWQYSEGSQVSQVWNAVVSGGNPYTAAPVSWNSTINPGQTVEFGFNGVKGSADTPAPVPAVTGAVCN
ncbi:PKD domain-containing protein [Exilibacterium tricleocarpae]|uniref:PKD domain-containing protein n=1 Tax=Exilibacterium tricleocarpae TaxID=2591008 RepID=A0A545TAF8_9GAMM|nr:glycoside hydrolase family 48 protein [Exilibacterium tricleocarpae]TQV74201.1 PKD domain-containing protein [Exilibacterium tricleocarpae]